MSSIIGILQIHLKIAWLTSIFGEWDGEDFFL